jgi:hypothetical protein
MTMFFLAVKESVYPNPRRMEEGEPYVAGSAAPWLCMDFSQLQSYWRTSGNRISMA